VDRGVVVEQGMLHNRDMKAARHKAYRDEIVGSSRRGIMTVWCRLSWVLLFAVAMAWLEASVVLYLRTVVGRLEPYLPNPLPHVGNLGNVEIIREAATLVVLFAVGCLAGSTPRRRWAFSLLAFGIWDLCYYLFLIPLTGWPRSLLDWDILFLIPVPWWSPVLAPLSISLLLVVGGVLVVFFDQQESPLRPGKLAAIAGGTGAALVLYSFMANSILALRNGIEAVRQTLPVGFSWPFFLFGIVLLAVPVLDIIRQVLSRSK
jgi:hypothetical protein